jgi:hypothetical protein
MGYAAMLAYQAYKDPTFLHIAENIWEYATNYTLTQAQLDAGQTSVKNYTLQAACNGGAPL